MTEENKAEQNPPAADAAKNATPAPAPSEAAPAQAAAPAQEAKPKETPKKEKPTNCVACNKNIKKIRWYFRDGKAYCTKRCWMTAKKKEADKRQIK